jgi:hypothetical protein
MNTEYVLLMTIHVSADLRKDDLNTNKIIKPEYMNYANVSLAIDDYYRSEANTRQLYLYM